MSDLMTTLLLLRGRLKWRDGRLLSRIGYRRAISTMVPGVHTSIHYWSDLQRMRERNGGGGQKRIAFKIVHLLHQLMMNTLFEIHPVTEGRKAQFSNTCEFVFHNHLLTIVLFFCWYAVILGIFLGVPSSQNFFCSCLTTLLCAYLNQG